MQINKTGKLKGEKLASCVSHNTGVSTLMSLQDSSWYHEYHQE